MRGGAVERLKRRYHLQPSGDPNVILHVVDGRWPFGPERRVALTAMPVRLGQIEPSLCIVGVPAYIATRPPENTVRAVPATPSRCSSWLPVGHPGLVQPFASCAT